MATPEAILSGKVAKWANYYGCLETKLDGGRGWPDRLFILPNGVVCFIEFKSPAVKKPILRPRQKLIIGLLERRKIKVLVSNDLDYIKNWLISLGLQV